MTFFKTKQSKTKLLTEFYAHRKHPIIKEKIRGFQTNKSCLPRNIKEILGRGNSPKWQHKISERNKKQ